MSNESSHNPVTRMVLIEVDYLNATGPFHHFLALPLLELARKHFRKLKLDRVTSLFQIPLVKIIAVDSISGTRHLRSLKK